jgi:hypothetical protein
MDVDHADNITPNPFPSGKGNQIMGSRPRHAFLHWVQGSPLPKEV